MGGNDVPHRRPLDSGVATVVERLELRQATEHVMEVLHALPWGIDGIVPRKDGARERDELLQAAETARAQQLELPARHLARDRPQISRADLVTGDAKVARRGRVERGGRRER